ncbi:MAG TPA: Rieske 2Fe-2S domain-containing protein [Burkholderiaceae bacterium]|nr:Rieske 2Fe-2S domain-containing protein [Burkholderiaceae bacterium]
MTLQPTQAAGTGDVYGRLVDADRGLISREIFSSPQLFQQELERLFTRAWLFVGHASQIPNPGDFFVSRMGAESVILTRDRASKIHVFLNTCRHRGMKVCLYDEGNAPAFVCPYHAWSYSLDGRLTGVPQYKELYEGRLDKDRWSLIEVAQMVDYKGTIWATWDPQAPPFEQYLGAAKEHLDLALDSRDGRPGGSEVFGGIQKWIIPCNWKLPAENFLGDTYHNISHRSVDTVGIGPSAAAGIKGRRDDELKGAQHVWVNFAGGHGVHSAIQPPGMPYVDAFQDHPVVEEYFRHCYYERQRRLGDRARLLPFVGTIFPNASYHGRQPRAICVWHPHGPESTEVWRFFLVDRDAPPEVKELLRRYYMRYSGPAGMTEQDDMENWNYATAGARGAIARRYPFNYQQSLGASRRDDPVPGNVSTQVSEENPRVFYRQWAQYLRGAEWPALMRAP